MEGTQGGMTYDTNKHTVVVDVTDEEGQLVATENYIGGLAVFTNDYVPSPDSVVIEVEKILEGENLRNGQFTFELVDKDSNEVIRTATNNANGQVIFDEITYDEVGEHKYTIRELKGTQGGVTYDETIFEVTVTVTDDGEGQLNATLDMGEEDSIVFTNTYVSEPDSVVFVANKILEGQDLRDGQFEFQLLDESEDVLQTVTNNPDGRVIFDEIQYVEVGEYAYTIREITGAQGGIDYDTSEFGVIVTVTDDGEGQLTATEEYVDGKVEFTNTYNTEPETVQFEARKILEGRDLKDDQFEFELVDSEGEVLKTASSNAEGQVIFEEITLDKVGEFIYTIREVVGVLGGVTYDSKEFDFKVTVKDNGVGNLHAEVEEIDGPAVFTNSYTVAPDRVVFEARKILEGQNLEENQFEFELVDLEGEILQTVSNNAFGQIIFDEIVYDEAGDYEYTIQEVQGTQPGITYEQNKINVLVNVADDGEGNLIAEASYNQPAEFTNSYTPNPGNVVLEAQKVLNGQNLVDGQFTFELVDESGDVIRTAENNADGQVIFDEIKYETPGKHTYIIQEVTGTQGGMTYDDSKYTVVVDVVDEEGQLEATANYIGGPAVFTNNYEADPDSAVIEASKILEGQELRKGQFEFQLLDESGEVLQTVSNNENGQVFFEEITYEEAGVYNYSIREVEGTQGGVTYDSTVYNLNVEVVDGREGQLIATVNYTDGPAVFTNDYTPNPDSVVIEVAKVLEGQDLRNDQFTFELVNESGEVIQTTTNNVNGQVIFDEITYNEVGEHTYTIREVEGVQGGVTYDESQFEVTVTVTDDGEGQLTAVLDIGEEEKIVFNNTYVSAPDRVVFEASKVLEGQDLRNDQFEFQLLDEAGEVLQTVTNNADGQVIFEEITYDKVGEYAYTIVEVEGVQRGVTYDTSQFEVTVTVTDDGEGQLTATEEYIDGPAQFTNKYSAEPVSVNFEAEKVLDGRHTDLEENEFTFEIFDAEENSVVTGTNNANGVIEFGAIEFTEVGSYEFTICEVTGDDQNINYDETIYRVTVEVTDDGEGQLVAEVVYSEEPIFTNEYDPVKVSVGDYVWIDENKDGLQDETDTPLEGLVLTIEDEEGNKVTDVYGNPVGPTTTDENGFYTFEDLPVDKTYTVRIDRDASSEALKGLEPTLEEQGDDNAIDSSTWEATSRHLTEDGDRDPTLDFGFIRTSVSVGDYVWFDENEDGLQDETDVPIEGVVLTIEDENGDPVTDVYGNQVGPVTTDENGYYIFENLPIGHEYTVRIDREASEEALRGYVPTLHEVGDDRSIDSSTWEATSRHLTKDGEHDPTLDFGFVIEKIDITGTKTWDDADNQDGKRPDTITVRLLANGEEVADIEVTSETDWTYEFSDLPKFKNGEEINYTIQEDSIEDYSTEINDFDIINSYTPGKTSVNVVKVWKDENNKDDRPDSITVNLLANGKNVDSIELKDDNNWQADFIDLDEYAAGEKIEYSIEEVEVDGFVTDAITGNAEDGFVITNNPAKVSVGDYVWFDQNEDGLQDETDVPLEGVVLTIEDENGDSVTDVYGNPVGPVTTDENGYYIFENLPIDHEYTVRIDRDASEEALKGYVPTLHEVGEDRSIDSSTWEATSRHLAEDGEHDPTLDFGFVIERIDITGTKTWEDADNQEGKRPKSITVNLLENGEKLDSVEVTEEENWSYSFEGLPKYKDGEEITYTITEDAVEGYETDINGFDITNSYTPETINVSGVKMWDDANNQDGKRPESITVNLLENGEKLDSVEVTEEDNWSYSFEGLPKYKDGEEITYTVTEEEVEGYETEINGFDITNSYTPETINVSGVKTWNDSDNQDGHRPDTITVNLLANGEELETVEVTDADDWSYSFTDLPKYNNGVEIVYTVTENTVENYTTEIDGFDITNHYTPGETSVTVTKHWDDAGNQDGIRPESIEVQLTADGEAQGDKIELSETNNWAHTWTELAKKADGTSITYSVQELTEVAGYEVSVNDENHGNIIITNSYTPETTEIAGTKTWYDADNADNTRPDTITVNLLANGEVIQSVKVTEADDWKYVFTNLPKYNAGEEIEYSITEEPVEGYETTIDGFDITNTLIPEEVDEGKVGESKDSTTKPGDKPQSPSKEKPGIKDAEATSGSGETDDGKQLPGTATNMFNILAIGLGLLILGIALTMYLRRKGA